MKAENAVTPSAEITSLGTHRFLDEFALAYHRAVTERLRREPQTVISHAQQNLNRWMESAAFEGGELQTLEEWQGILDGSDVDRLVEIITDTSEEGQRLRSSSPFVGTLSPEKRLEILAACEQRAIA
jgi:hypothetical protein